MIYLLLLFTVVPLVELWLLVRLSGVFGFWTTIFVVLATGALGTVLARWQGWRAMQRVQSEMRQGLLPAKALGDGALILVAGVLLITPGIITDVVGLALLAPPLRALVRNGLKLWFANHIRVQTSAHWQTRSEAPTGDTRVVEGRIVDAHVVESDRDGPTI